MDAIRARMRARRAWPRFPRAIAVGATIGALLLGSVAPVAAAEDKAATTSLGPGTSIVAWDLVGAQAVAAAGLTPPDGHVVFAYVGIAVYDAVTAIHGRYRPFAVDVDAPGDASADAAVAAAAHAILAHYLPAQQATIIDPAYAAALGALADGPPKAAGIALGEQVAAALITMRTGDGYRAPGTYTAPDPPVPGAWIPTAATPPISVTIGQMRPFAIASGDQFRPDGPPALLSRQWAADFNETREIGSSTSATRTAAQTLVARFWAEPPVAQARASFRRFVVDHGLDVLRAARFMAMVSVVYADALIACFDAKYHFAFWRPITAIRAGDTDGNDATIGLPTWSPLLAGTPNHPEYPSAHSCITPAGGIVVSRFLGTDEIDFTVPSVTGLGDRTFGTVEELQQDVAYGRMWGGIHFRSAVEDGSVIARKVANYVLARNFKVAGH